MAVQFMDGFEHYDLQTDVYLKWTNANSAIPTTFGRNGRGLQIGQVYKTLNHQAGWVTSFAMYIANTSGVPLSNMYVQLNVSTQLMALMLAPDFTLAMFSGGNLACTSTPVSIHTGTWNSYQVKVAYTVGGMSGVNVLLTASVKLNGVVVMSCTNVDSGIDASTLFVAGATTDVHSFVGPATLQPTFLDDVVIADTSGNGVVNDFFGDVAIGLIQPAADVTTDWTPTPAGSSYVLVNSQFPENSLGTISDNNPTDQDNFDWQPISGGAIVALHYGIFARKNAEGTRSFQPTIGGIIPSAPANNAHSPSSAPFSGYPPPIFYPGDSYQYYFFAMDSEPGGSPTPWTAAAVNATTFGVELIS